MLKYFVWSFCLGLLAGQVFCEEPAPSTAEVDVDELAQLDLNETDNYIVPQPRFRQVRFDAKSYTLNFLPVNWHTARELCAAQNQVLASIKTNEEHAGIMDTLSRHGLRYSDLTFWIGGSQLGHLGQWNWVSNGQPIVYSNWLNQYQYDCCDSANCLELLSNGQWHGNDCDLKRAVICEELPTCA